VRSPAEFAEDHVPGAVSLPVLTNEERARVGTIYVQDSAFLARKIGAALVARNAAAHIEGPLAGHDNRWRPLLYCWRGGQRSGSFAIILREVGWRAATVEGGYRTWRRLVQDALYNRPLAHRLILLDGNTGTGKTALLTRVAAAGGQVLDLEGLARHRGSVLGAMPGGQPAQKGFESALAAALDALDPARPVLVEAESAKVGQLSLPPSLWSAMLAAPRIAFSAPVAARAQWLADQYRDLTEAPESLAALLDGLRTMRGNAVVDGWHLLLKAGDWVALAQALITQHYDPGYARSRRPAVQEVALAGLGPQDMAGATGQILRLMDRLGAG
jgi:tRNA 2-selenouridine synthase